MCEEPSLAKSYRPISLSSFMLKTLKMLMDRFLREVTMTRRPLAFSEFFVGNLTLNNSCFKYFLISLIFFVAFIPKVKYSSIPVH